MKNASQLEEPQRIRCISITNRDQSRKSSPRLNEKVCHCSSGSLCTMSHQTQSPLPLSHTSALPWAKGVQRLYKRTSFINSICIQPFILHPDHPLLTILINQCHEHDIKLRSRLTGHEWIIVSPYDGSSCEILHRHSDRNSFHHQKGQHSCLSKALDYIRSHDCWYSKKERLSASLHLHKRHQKGSFIPQKLPKIKYHLFHEPMLPAANMIRTALRPG